MGYDVNYGSDNMKLLLMLLACVAAMIAQFYPIPFPENRAILGICCGSYFAMSCVLQFIVTFIDKDTIAITNSLKVRIQMISLKRKSNRVGSSLTHHYFCTTNREMLGNRIS